MKKILILGASGFIGSTIYKELSPYYKTYGTYFSNKKYSLNKQFFRYDIVHTNLTEILKEVIPNLIISSLRGPFEHQIEVHGELIDYIKKYNCRVMFLSSSNVFDAFEHYPSYEYDKTLSESIYGKLKIKIENKLLKLHSSKYIIIRLPMVFGKKSPRTKEIDFLIKNNLPIEVFPNIIINVNSNIKLSQQIHYIINKKLTGIYHLGSYNLISHYEFIKLITKKRTFKNIIFKHVFASNQLRYLAVLSKKNKLPSHLNNTYESVLNDIYISQNGF